MVTSVLVDGAPMKKIRGELRADGYVFWEYRKKRDGTFREYWLSPNSVEKKRKAQKRWQSEQLQDPAYRQRYNTRMAKYMLSARRARPKVHMLARVKARAKKFGIPFSLTVADIVIPEICPVLGIPLRIADGVSDDYSPELDRIVPAVGYVSGNVLVISRRANRIKNNATLEELQKIALFYTQLSPLKPIQD